MYCSKCGKEITGKERFCPHCGNEVAMITENDIQHTVADNVSSTKSKNKDYEQNDRARKTGQKSHRRRKIVLATACCLILALIGVTAYFFVAKRTSGEQYLAVVQNEEGKWGYINEKGKEVIPCEYDFAYNGWTQGVTVIGEKTGEVGNEHRQCKYGLINAKGEVVIEPQYDDFSMGNGIIAMAEQVDQDKEGEPVLIWGLFNSDGDMITDFKYQSENRLSACLNENGLTVVSDATGEVDSDGDIIYNYGVVNERGEEIIPLQYPYISDAENCGNQGLILTEKKIGNGYRYGFVNYQNERKIPYRYEEAHNFSENGLAAVSQDEKWGYINTDGDIVIPCKYEDVTDFSGDDLAFVVEDGACRCINKKGETVIPSDRYQEYGKWTGASWIGNNTDYAEIYIETDTGDEVSGVIKKDGSVIIDPSDTSSFYSWYYSVAFTLYQRSGENGETVSYSFVTGEGEQMEHVYDYAGWFSEKGWCSVGSKIGTDSDGHNRYHYRYIDENEETVLELPEKYIYAFEFRPVNQK